MKRLIIIPIVALLAVSQMAATQEPIAPECRREVMQLCGKTRDRDVIKACLKEKSSQLTTGCRDEIKSRMGGRGRGGRKAEEASPVGPTSAAEYKYGTDAAQALDYFPVAGKANAPLIIFVHGGAWMIGDKGNGAGTKPAFYNELGYAFASVNYRLIPRAKPLGATTITPDDQAVDVANAVAYLRKDAAKLGFDPNHIIMMGHSAGAHLAALVSVEPRYFATAGVPIASVKGTVLLDGAGYDVARQMAAIAGSGRSDARAGQIYDRVFGKDAAVQKALSPVTYVAAPNTPNWLILYVANRDDSRAQSEALAKGLADNKTAVNVQGVPDSTHQSVNQDAGKGGTFVGDAIAAFLAKPK